MATVQISDGETTELVSAQDITEGYRVSVLKSGSGPVRLSHSRAYASDGQEFPRGSTFTVGDLRGTSVYAHAPGGDVALTIEDASFSILNPFRTSLSGSSTATGGDSVQVEDTAGAVIDPFDQGQIEGISASTTATGAGNAASLSLGHYRNKVDILADVNGSATVTVEVQDGAGTWVPFDTFSVSSPGDTLQVETVADDIRAYADQNLDRLELASKGV